MCDMRIAKIASALLMTGVLALSQRMMGQVFPLHTSGAQIVDANGVRARLNGVNWYGAEGTDYVVTGLQYNTLPNIAWLIKQQGYNVVRLPWSNQLYESNPVVSATVLTANPGLQGLTALQIMDQVINALGAEGLMVILDNHESTAGICCGSDVNQLWYNTAYPESSWLSDWRGMTARYSEDPWVIGADLRNELRGTATWTGTGTASSPGTDWMTGAERGGNAILRVNPHLLVFVEGLGNASDLSCVRTLPVVLSQPNQLVYEAHDYSWYSGAQPTYAAYLNWINPKWAYLVTGSNPQPLWLGEFGTCHTGAGCTNYPYASLKPLSDPQTAGLWWSYVTKFITDNSVDWAYWALNGTAMSGNGFIGPTQPEIFGILDTTWTKIAEPQHNAGLQSLIANASGASPPLTVTSIDDTTTGTGTNQFDFSGTWSSGAQTGAYGGSNHWSSTMGSSYSLTFTGTQAVVYNAESNINGISAISIDGGTATNVDNWSGDTSGKLPINYSVPVYVSPILANGSHTLNVSVTGAKNSSATDVVITADRVNIVAPTTSNTMTSINDTNSAFKYSGSWSYYSPQKGAVDSDNHYSDTTGASYTVTFTGSQATLYGVTGPRNGIASISVDGGTTISVDLYASSTTYRVPVFRTFILPSGIHTLTVTVTGMQNPSATSDYVTADQLDVIAP